MKNKSKEKERVTIFGGDWDSDGPLDRRHDRNGFAGFLFIAAGIILLLNTMNIVSWKVWDEIWKFWPILLIYWGIEIIFGFNRFFRIIISMVMAVLIVILILFAINQVNPNLLKGLPPVFFQIFNYMEGIIK